MARLLTSAAFLSLGLSCLASSISVSEESDDLTVSAAGGSSWVDKGYTSDYVSNGRPVWRDVSESEWCDTPGFLDRCESILPDHDVRGHTRTRFVCTATDHCDLYAFSYKCPPCDYDKGDFHHKCIDNDWEPFRCAPKVHVKKDGYKHGLLGFHKRIRHGETEVLEFGERAEFVAYCVQEDALVCDTLASKGACENTKGRCDWEDGACYTARCMQHHHVGPVHPGHHCHEHCIKDDYDHDGEGRSHH